MSAVDQDPIEIVRLIDENEQLRTALESTLEENARVGEDRDRLLARVTILARELHTLDAERTTVAAAPEPFPLTLVEAQLKQGQAEEELRVAFEELQVLAEELELANSGLQRANEDLELRVRDRTRELTLINGDLRRTEARLSTLIEGMPQLVWRSRSSGDWTWCSPQWSATTGQSVAESRDEGWLDALHPDDRETARRAWMEAQRSGALSFEARIREAARGGYRHFQTRAAPVRNPEGLVVEWLGTCTDIDDLLRLQEQQSVLVAELQHRTRNLMAVVQAVTHRTIKGSRTLDDFRRCMDDRMGALARVQGLLSRRGSQRVAFDTLLRAELGAHADADVDTDGRLTLEGPPDIPLETSLVQTFALALHELATNAAKYGALSSNGGALRVAWDVRPGDHGQARLHVDWRESGVTEMPDANARPAVGGYGRELIERALPYQLGAATSYRFAEDGVHCTIEVDVPPEKSLRGSEHV